MSAAWLSCTARQVSSTSLLVMPRWTKRLSGPIFSASQVRKAITSWRVSRSISSMRATSAAFIAASAGAPRSRIVRAASDGTWPSSAIASAASDSMRNHVR